MNASFHAYSRLLLAIALAVIACPVTGASPSTDAFVLAEAVRPHSQSLFNKPLFTTSEGDFVHPRLSPDGSKLIYADVLVREGIEGTAIYITDLASKATRKLLSEDEAEKYQVYKVFASNIRWLDNSRVEVYLADGDVGATCLTFDVITNAVVSERSIELDDDEDMKQVPHGFEAVRAKILAAFPSWTAEVLDSTLQHRPINTPDGSVILQRNYAGFDHDIWLVDPGHKKQTRLLSMRKDDLYALGGGLIVQGDTIFAVSRDPSVYLFRLGRTGEMSPLGRFPKTQWRPEVTVRFGSNAEALFILRLGRTYERGHNPVFQYSGADGLVEVSDCPNCYDFDVSANGMRAVFSSWVSGRRQLQVLERVP